MSEEVLVIEDTLKDKRFNDNPMVINDPHIRFYAGVPIHDRQGKRVGAFCVKDKKPRQFNNLQIETLKSLAKIVEYEMNYRERRQID